jgi:hypothetical protein
VNSYFDTAQKLELRYSIKLAIFPAQISEIGRHCRWASGRPGDDRLRRERSAVPVEVVGEPAVQCAELSAGDLAQNIGMRLYGRRKELRAQDISDGVALKSATDASAIPVYVLQAAVAIVRRQNTEISLHAGAPGLRQVLDPNPSFEEF